uniref:Granzyme H n=1 Tax=Moschus moschiferus TaxID=68415 RepID=A0A8C6G1Y1_MOSMO
MKAAKALWVSLLFPRPQAEIIGGHEAKPHSRPYMALVQFLGEKSWKRCGGVLIQKDFVLTAAHCRGRKAKQTSAVKPLSLPRAKARVKPGQVCSLAGWGQVALGTPISTLQEAELTVQEDHVCESLYPRHYSRATQICVGDPRKVKTGFKGDSGGPLVCKKVVHGTFSYGKMNGIPPGVFTQVSHFLPWIKRTMKRL